MCYTFDDAIYSNISRIIVAIEFQCVSMLWILMLINAKWHDLASKIATQTEARIKAKAKVRHFCQIVIIDNGRFLLPKNISLRECRFAIIFIANTCVFQIVLSLQTIFISKLIWCVARIVQSDWLMHRVDAPNVSSVHLLFLLPAHILNGHH